jgi:hypothetical protein
MGRLKFIALIFFVFFCPKNIIGQNQFKKLELNWDDILPIFPKTILEANDHYIIMGKVNGMTAWQLLAIDLYGNYSYRTILKIFIPYRNFNMLFFDSKYYISDLNNLNILDTLGNFINQKYYFNDTLISYPNMQIQQTCYDTLSAFNYSWIKKSDTSTTRNPLIFKTNNGTVIWSKIIGGSWGKNVLRTFDHCIIGYDGALYGLLKQDSISSVVDYKNYQVLKTDTSNGNLIWAKKYFETPYFMKEILPYDNTSFLLYGNNSNDENNPYYDDTLIVARVDTSGAVLWCRKYKTATGVFPLRGVFSNIINTKDGGFLLAAPEWRYQGQTNTGGSLAMVKFDSQFNVQWGRSHYYGNPRAVIQTSDGGYLVAGDAAAVSVAGFNFYSYIIKTDSLGLSGCYEDTLVGVTYTTMSVTPVTMNYTTDTVSIYTMLTTAGDTMLGTYSEYDACILLGVAPSVTVKNSNSPLLVYPNPASTILNIQPPNPQRGNELVKSIALFDMQGRLVLQSAAVNQYPLQLNVAGLTPGIYAVKVICNLTSYFAKVVVKAP